MYYEINEETAKASKLMMSLDDYEENSTTNEYRTMCDRAQEIAEEQKQKHPECAETIDMILNRYCRKLAEWINRENAIGTMCPSVMIAGPAGINRAKKEKQIAAYKRNAEKYEEISGLISRIQSVGTGGIKEGDANALEKLKNKLENMEECYQTMKKANAYYKNNGTLDGFYLFDEITEEKMHEYKHSGQPFSAYTLQNCIAEIRRIKARIASITAVKEEGGGEKVIKGIRVVEDTDDMRIRLIFPDKPDEETRNALKANGFRWSPKNSAWQRMLNANGRWAAKNFLATVKDESNES